MSGTRGWQAPSVPRWLLIGWGVVSVVLTILTLPSVPEDVSGWAPVLSAVDDAPLRWLLPVIGWLAMALLLFSLWNRAASGISAPEVPPESTRAATWNDVQERYATWNDLSSARVPLWRDVEGAIVAAIDEGREILGDQFRSVDLPVWLEWRDRTSKLIEAVYGPRERERFARPPKMGSVDADLEAQIERLGTLLDRIPSMEIRVAADAVATAVRDRDPAFFTDEQRTQFEILRAGTSAPAPDLSNPFTRARILERRVRNKPDLSFGRAVIPRSSQALHLLDPNGERYTISGRIIRAPVVNAHGAAPAQNVHARIHFMPDDVHRTFAPQHPAQGEWFSEAGPEIEIEIPGNGRPRLLDVVAIIDKPYPFAYEWTTHSRAAGLAGYGIKGEGFEIEVEVLGTDLRLVDRLRVDTHRPGILVADWITAGYDEATNYVPWKRPRS